MSKIKRILLGLGSFFTLMLCFGTVRADSVHFSVSPDLPQNQIDPKSGYFDLLMKPGEQEALTVKLVNGTDKTVTVNTTFAAATTANSGLAVYIPSTKAKDKTLSYDLAEYVTLPKQVKIPARSTIEVKATVKMPSTTFTGVLAGGFSFKEAQSETPSSDQSKSGAVSVINEYRYVVALLLRQNKTAVDPQLSLNNVAPAQVNSRNVIQANLSNGARAYLNQMNVTATVQGVDDPSLKYSFANAAMQMAPNSNFDLPIPVSIQGNLNGQSSEPLKAGKYHLSMTVYGSKNPSGKYETTVDGQKTTYDYRWTFEKDFEVTSQEAKKLNQSDPTVSQKAGINWIMIVGLAIIILLLLVIFLLLLLKRKKRQPEEEEVEK